MKKKLLIFALAISVAVLPGCEGVSDTLENHHLVLIEDDYPLRFYYDKDTNVMYMNDCRDYGGGWTVLLNSDGTPILYGEGTSG